jgi:hypothetical protein
MRACSSVSSAAIACAEPMPAATTIPINILRIMRLHIKRRLFDCVGTKNARQFSLLPAPSSLNVDQVEHRFWMLYLPCR